VRRWPSAGGDDELWVDEIEFDGERPVAVASVRVCQPARREMQRDAQRGSGGASLRATLPTTCVHMCSVG